MNRTMRRFGVAALAATLVVPTGCASSSMWRGAGWEVGMMGAMVVGGLILGRGMMHGAMGPGRAAVADSVRFEPTRLLEQRELLELDDGQVAALESLRDEVATGQRSAADAARAAWELLRPVQRAAASRQSPTHHQGSAHHGAG